MELQKSLIQLGLTEKQATVYLACLQLGTETVLHVSKFANLKRPTVYLILDELETMGLVSRIQRERKILFKAENPEAIISQLKLKQETALAILPSLKAIHNIDPEKPTIRIHEGISGVKNVYTEIFTYLASHPDKELLIFGSLKDTLEHFESQVVDLFYRSINKVRTSVREIGNDDHETRKQIFVTTIESSPITETYRTLFEMAWRSGKRI